MNHYLTQFFDTEIYISNKNYIIKRFEELKSQYAEEIYKTHGLVDIQLSFNNSYECHAYFDKKGITISNFILVNPFTTNHDLEDTICHEFAHAITKSPNHTKGWKNNFKRIYNEGILKEYTKINFPPFLRRYSGNCSEGCEIHSEEIVHTRCLKHNLFIKYSQLF